MEMALQSSAFILLLILLRPWMKRAVSAQFRYALWLIPAIRLLIPLSMSSPVSIWRFTQMKSPAMLNGAATVPQHIVSPGAMNTITQTTEKGLNMLMPSSGTATATAPSALWQPSVAQIAVGVWMLGIAIALAWLLINNYRLRKATGMCGRLFSLGLPLPVYVVDKLPSPCLVGLFRPRILLNQAAIQSQEMLDMVLLHELTHWNRKDHFWTVLRAIINCLWW